MESNRPANENKQPLSRGEKGLVALTGCVSLPGYLFVVVVLLALIVGPFLPKSDTALHGRMDDVFGGALVFLPLLGVFGIPLSLLVVTVGSFFPIGARGKVMAWMVAAGGILLSLILYSIIWVGKW